MPPGSGDVDIGLWNQQSSQNTKVFAFASPVLDSLSQNTSDTPGGDNLKIEGRNFGDDPTVTIGLEDCEITYYQAGAFGELNCTIPPGSGSNRSIILNAGGMDSNAMALDYNPPSVSSVDPDTATTDQQLLTILGSNFATAGTVTVGGVTCRTIGADTLWDHSEIRCQLPATNGGADHPLVVTVSGQSHELNYSYTQPVIDSITPSNSPAVGGEIVQVRGTDFGEDSAEVRFNGLVCMPTATPQVHIQIECVVPAGQGRGELLDLSAGFDGVARTDMSFVPEAVYEETSSSVLFGGTSVLHRAPIFFFELPSSPDLNVIADAELKVYAIDEGRNPTFNTDLYGLGYVVSNTTPTIDGAWHYCGDLDPRVAGDYSLSGTASKITDSWWTPSATQGSKSTSVRDHLQLIVDAVNADPSVNETHRPWFVYRLSPDACTEDAWGIGTNEHSNPIYRPALTFATTDYPVYVEVGGQLSPPFYFNYDAPEITGISPSSAPTNPAQSLTIYGSNLKGLEASVRLGAQNVSFTAVNHSRIEVPIPWGTGSDLGVEVTVADQTGVSPMLFSYYPPAVVSVSGCTDAYPTTHSCLAAGGQPLFIFGSNFGGNTGVVSVTVGGKTAFVTNCTHIQIDAVMPSRAQGGFNLPVVVTVDGQSDTVNFVSYEGPAFAAGDFQTNRTGTWQTLVEARSGDFVKFEGEYFGNDPNNISVVFGLPGDDKPFSCNIVDFLNTTITNTTITCQIVGGMGSGLVWQVTVDQRVSAESVQSFKTPEPVIVQNTLRSELNATGNGELTGSFSSGDSIFLTVEELGLSALSMPELVRVTFGPSGQEQLYDCVVQRCHDSGLPNVTVECTTPSGVGGPFWLQVQAYNQWSVVSTDWYQYPKPPVVHSVHGCNDTGNMTVDCPTSGALELTISGSSFSSAGIVVNLGLFRCQGAHLDGASGHIFCTLPEGAGQPVAVTVTIGILGSVPVPYLSYAEAVITQVSGCSDTGLDTEECDRDGGDVITVTGENFGLETAVVLVGAALCEDVTHTVPHSELTCTLPEGTRQSLDVSVYQRFGVLTPSTRTVSYEKCPAGMAAPPDVPTCLPCPAGSYSSIPGSESCTLCPSGTYSNASASICTPCERGTYSQLEGEVGPTSCLDCKAGTYNDLTGQENCVPCEGGSISGPKAFVCVQCEAGFWQSLELGTPVCTPCIPGTFASFRGATVCSNCELGTVSADVNATACIPCGPGEMASSPGLSVCELCPIGSVNPSSGQGACNDCGEGYFANDTGLETCFACPAGTYSEVRAGDLHGPTRCYDCTAGEYTDVSGQKECVLCPTGTFSTAQAATKCQQCAAGEFSDTPGTTYCEDCPQATYSSTLGYAVCAACPIGTFQNETGRTACQRCPVGFHQELPNQVACEPCPVGSAMSSLGQPVCAECPAGTFANVTGMDVCEPCPAGSYSPRGADECTLCPIQTFGAAPGAESCKACAVGTFGHETGLVECERCAQGTFAPLEGSSTCVNCSAGSYTDVTGSNLCLPCPPGTLSQEGSSLCEECPAGWYQPASGQLACLSCAAGSYSSSTGAVECNVCPTGTYISVPGSDHCDPCSEGHYSQTGQVGCTACGLGTFTNALGQATCEPCPAGRYSDGTGATACTFCSSGSQAPARGSPFCSNCTMGTFSAGAGTVFCTDCPMGTYTDWEGASHCEMCPTGEYQPATGQSSCIKCASGTANSFIGKPACVPCEGGFFASEPGRATCAPCPPGSFSEREDGSDVGALSCTPCPERMYSPASGQAQCLNCPVGRFNDQPGQSSCFQCPAGTANLAQGQLACTPCAPGTAIGVTGSVICQACAPGTYANESGQVACTACRTGTFQASLGRVECDLCDYGHYAPTTGLSACLNCDPGQVISYLGADGCVDCPGGWAQSVSGEAACDICLPGTFSEQGYSFCDQCAPGTYANETQQVACTPCAMGSSQLLSGQVSCDSCRAGTVAPAEGFSECTPCPAGSFADSIGGSACQPCPPGQAQINPGRASCSPCPAGTFSEGGWPACQSCPVGQVSTLPESVDCIQCDQYASTNTEQTMCVCDKGYAARYLNNSIICQKCHEGAVCNTRGLDWDELETEEGWWSLGDSYYRCIFQLHCLGGLVSECDDNREGMLCAICKPGYYSSFGEECRACGDTAQSYSLFILMALAILFVLFLLCFVMIRIVRPAMKLAEDDEHRKMQALTGFGAHGLQDDDVANEELMEKVKSDARKEATQTHRYRHEEATLFDHGPPRAVPNITFKIKIVLSFIQVLTIMAASLEIQWPVAFKSFVSWLSVVNMDFFAVLNVGCVFPKATYYDKLPFMLATPVALIALVLITYWLPMTILYKLKKDKIHKKSIRRHTWRLVLFILFLSYPAMCSAIFRSFVCKEVLGTDYLLADFNLECYTTAWNDNALLAGIMIFVYPIGVPAFFIYMLHRYRREKRLDEAGVRAQLGFIYDGYHRDRWFYEVTECAFKLVMTSAIAFFPYSLQMGAGIIVIFFYMCAIFVQQPYIRKGDDRLAFICLTELLLILLSGYVLNGMPVVSYSMQVAIAFVLIGIVVLLLLYFLVQVLAFIRKWLRQRRKKRKRILEGQDPSLRGALDLAELHPELNAVHVMPEMVQEDDEEDEEDE